MAVRGERNKGHGLYFALTNIFHKDSVRLSTLAEAALILRSLRKLSPLVPQSRRLHVLLFSRARTGCFKHDRLYRYIDTSPFFIVRIIRVDT